jgi:integrase
MSIQLTNPHAPAADTHPESGAAQQPRLLHRVRDRIRFKHYSIRTEQAYVFWIRRFVVLHGRRHPSDMGAAEVVTFLTHLAVDENVAASSQNQAKSALLFLYRDILGTELPWMDDIEGAKRPRRLPVVLTAAETAAVLDRIAGIQGLVARLLYGTGMRLMEALRLRIKDVEFARREIVVREGKGAKAKARRIG